MFHFRLYHLHQTVYMAHIVCMDMHTTCADQFPISDFTLPFYYVICLSRRQRQKDTFLFVY